MALLHGARRPVPALRESHPGTGRRHLDGEWWKFGGGGTVWDAITYDPELNLVYIGVGNGTPWNRRLRSPGGGDTCSWPPSSPLMPIRGAYAWHYQTAPGDTWDFTATQHIMLADLEIGGETRKALMQAPKKRLLLRHRRTNGELLSAEPFVEVTWASRIDMRTGVPSKRPMPVTRTASSPARRPRPAAITGTPWPTTPVPGWSISRPRTCPGCTRKWRNSSSARSRSTPAWTPSSPPCRKTRQSRNWFPNNSRATCWPGTP